MLKKNSDICYEKILEIPCLNCPYKPQGSMVVMVNSLTSTKLLISYNLVPSFLLLFLFSPILLNFNFLYDE